MFVMICVIRYVCDDVVCDDDVSVCAVECVYVMMCLCVCVCACDKVCV